MATTVDELKTIISADASKFEAELAKVNKHLAGLGKNADDVSNTIGGKFSKSVDGIAGKLGTVAKVGLVALGGGLLTVSGLSLKAAGDFETMGVALETSFQGNKEAAAEAQKTITAFASTTPFQLGEVMTAFIKLKNMGLDPSMEALTSYGDTASAMGKSLNDMIEAVADAATGEFERLKEFGIRASSEGDKVTFTFKGVSKTVGKNSKEIEGYLKELGKTNFAGGMEKQSKTLMGTLSTLKDTFSLSLSKIAVDSGLLDFVKDGILRVTNALATIDFSGMINGFINGIKPFVNFMIENQGAVVAGLTAIGVALLSMVVPAMVTTIATALPMIALFTAIGAAGALLYEAWTNNWGGMRDTILVFWEGTLKPLLTELWTWLSINIPIAIAAVKSWWDANWPAIAATLQGVWNNILLPIFTAVWDMLKVVIPAAIDVLVWTWNNVLMPALQGLKWLWDNVLSPVIGFIVNALQIIVPAAINFLKGVWTNVLVPLFTAFKWAYDNVLSPVIRFIVEVFTSVIRVAINALKSYWDNTLVPIFAAFRAAYDSIFRPLVDMLIGQFNRITGGFDNIKRIAGSIFDGMGAGLKFALNAVIAQLNSGIRSINVLISGVNNIPGVSISQLPQIPQLAVGVNRVPRDMLAVIHKDEAVVPASMNPYNPGATRPMSNEVGGRDVEIKEVNIYNNMDYNKLVMDLNFILS